MIYQSIPEQPAPVVHSIEERQARAYRLAMATGSNDAAHTGEWDYYASPVIWTAEGSPSKHTLLTAELRRQDRARRGAA